MRLLHTDDRAVPCQLQFVPPPPLEAPSDSSADSPRHPLCRFAARRRQFSKPYLGINPSRPFASAIWQVVSHLYPL
jgi:hypothetical protein